MAENIISFSIYLFTACIMLGIGIFQLRSKTPVAFYSGEKPPREDELTDVHAWNRKHGMMWVIYGVIIILSAIIGCPMAESMWCMIPLCGGVMIPIVVMIWYHHRLVKKYRK